jgi:16S rRNA (adenine1518-N6/adenine1519-N6)-dimethyltransferase
VETLQAICDALELKPGETVVEVGPGIGFLTRVLDRTGARVVGVDLDRETIERLQNIGLKNTEIKHGDILHFDLNTFQFIRKNRGEASRGDALASPGSESPAEIPTGRIKVAGNVPYQITGLIIGHLLGEIDKPSPWIHRIDNIVLTVQYEVALRMVARPGEKDYSRLSILVDQYCEAEIVQRVPADRFYPPPQVNSAVVKLTPRKEIAVTSKNLTLTRHLVVAGFKQRRKMFRNALGFLRLPQAEVDAVFAKLGMDPQVRAERLSLNQFAMLADAFHEKGVNAKAESLSSGEDQSDL